MRSRKNVKSRININAGLVERIRSDILSEKLYPGKKLTEKDICEKYEISRTPVREALKTLETEGLIELIPNRGAFVIGLTTDDIIDLLKLRKTYEIQAIEWAIDRITEEEEEELEKCYEYMKFYTKQNEIKKVKEINDNFHKIICNATHNRMLINILSLYNYYIKHSALTNTCESEDLEKILREHTKIYKAIRARDANAGVEATIKHNDNGAKRYLRNK